MSRIRNLVTALVLSASFAVGTISIVGITLTTTSCSANALKDQYRTIGVVVNTVNFAMNAWGDYVRAGKATAAQQAEVRKFYGAYQGAVRTAQVAYKLGDGSATPTDLAMAAGALIGIIEAFTGSPMPNAGGPNGQ